MEPVIATAILGSLTTLLAVLLTHYLNNRSRRRRPGERIAGLVGRWQGSIEKHIPKNDTPSNYQISIELRIRKGEVIGAAITRHIADTETVEQHLRLKGEFIDNKYVKLEYTSKSTTTTEYGTIMLSLSSDANCMAGRWVGYGRRTEDIVSGSIAVKRTT